MPHSGERSGAATELLIKVAAMGTAATLAFGGIARVFSGGETGSAPVACGIEQINQEQQPLYEHNPFADEQARCAADELGITVGSYFKVSEKVVEGITKSGLFASADYMAPIFLPAVMQHEEQIITAAHNNNIPPNILASIVTIESAGNEAAHSGADAYGLGQLVPHFQYDKFAEHLPGDASLQDYKNARDGRPSRYPLSTYTNVFLNPEYNLDGAAQYLSQCIATARNSFPKLNANSPVIYAFAAAFYNGGASKAHQPYKEWPTETQRYVDHTIRNIMDVELALILWSEHKIDNANDLLHALRSKEVDAIVYGLEHGDKKGVTNIAEKFSKIGSLSAAAEEYSKNPDEWYKWPLTPGQRLWANGYGGAGLAAKDTINQTQDQSGYS